MERLRRNMTRVRQGFRAGRESFLDLPMATGAKGYDIAPTVSFFAIGPVDMRGQAIISTDSAWRRVRDPIGDGSTPAIRWPLRRLVVVAAQTVRFMGLTASLFRAQAHWLGRQVETMAIPASAPLVACRLRVLTEWLTAISTERGRYSCDSLSRLAPTSLTAFGLGCDSRPAVHTGIYPWHLQLLSMQMSAGDIIV